MVDTHRNLLVGVLALQCHLVTGPRLVAALEAWVKDKRRPLDAILLEQGALERSAHGTLLALVDRHLAQWDHEVDRSLAVFSIDPAFKSQLQKISDPELQVAVSRLTLCESTNGHLVGTLAVTVPHADGATPLSGAPAGGTFDFASLTSSTAMATAESPAAPDARFLILRPHAKGGLGEVFLAQDRELNRQVALKEIQARHASRKSSRARFVLEAEVTGSLEHPGIVPVYGMGSYPDGRPYYAMRFIKGDSFDGAIGRFHATDWRERGAAQRSLELRRLLRCFIDVCNAIEYAHSRGVLHRDLKPANIMLGHYGETLVVDWGLAKMLDRPESAVADEAPLEPAATNAIAGTRMGAAVGTPNFMSPEQAAGRLHELGPASDVFSLGATLYNLLTGSAPLEGREVAVVLESAKSGQFPPPREIDRHVPKPLEAVCLRAMALRPCDRYPSARALADDIEHWLADEATVAYRETWRERLLRFARRHKTWTQAAAAAISVVAVVAVVASLLIDRSRRDELAARHSAEESFLQARRTVDDFFTRISENKLLDVPGLQPLRRELLAAAAEYYRGFIKQRRNDPSVRGELAETHYRLGLVAGEIDDKAAALDSLLQALALQRSLATENPSSPAASIALANTANAIGGIKQDLGELAAALDWFDEARSIRASLVRQDPRDASLRRKLANSHNNLATVLARQGKRELAEREFDAAGAMRAALAKENLETSIYQRDLAQGYYNLAQYKKESDDLAGALEASAKAALAFQSLVDKDSRVIDHRRELAWTHRMRGDLLAESGRTAEAVTEFDEARKIAERLAQQNPLLLELQSDVAAIYAELGRIKHRTAELPQAALWYDRSRIIREQLVAADPDVERYARDLASCELHLGMAHLDVGSLAEALESFDRARHNYAALCDKSPADSALLDGLAQTHRNIGLVYRAQGEPAQALAAFEETRRIFARLAEQKTATVAIKMGLADAHLNIAVDQRALGRLDEASAAASQAVGIQAAVATANPKLPEGQYVYAETLYMRGLLELGRSEHAAAFDTYRAAVTVASKLADEQTDNLKYRSMLGTSLDKQAVALWLVDRRDEAMETALKASAELQTAFDAAPQVVQYRLNLSDSYFNLAKFERDSGHIEQSIAATLKRKALWPASPAELLRAACELSLSAQSLGEPAQEFSQSEPTERSRLIAAAIETLREAIAAGWSDLDAIRNHAQLAALRDEPEFQKLLAESAEKSR